MNRRAKDHNTDLFQELDVPEQAREAWGAIYVLYWEAIARAVIKKFPMIDEQTAEDLATGALVKLWTKRTEVASLDIPRDWLFRVATIDALDHLKTEMRRKQRPLEEADMEIPDEATTGEGAETDESWKLIQRTMERLPPQTWKTITMKYVDGIGNKKIAELLGKSPQTVGNQVQKGIQKLKQWMNAKGPHEKQK